MLDTTFDMDDRSHYGMSNRNGSPDRYFTCKFCQRLFRKAYNLMIHERSHDTAKYSADIYKLRNELSSCGRRDLRLLLARAVQEENLQTLKLKA